MPLKPRTRHGRRRETDELTPDGHGRLDLFEHIHPGAIDSLPAPSMFPVFVFASA
jgi:hypothetical protein